MNHQILEQYLTGKKVAILGFGKEGQSSYVAIRRMLPGFPLLICDQNEDLNQQAGFLTGDDNTRSFFGSHYLEGLQQADLIIRSPGISFKSLETEALEAKITSQTEIFLELFGRQVTGITGTKGKSTTSSLLFHILQHCGIEAVLAGNIGVPPFDLLPQITPSTRIVFEMSSHQLENIQVSPHVAILLNIFQEHLDHYHSYEHYQQAKLNIARWQLPEDFFLYNSNNEMVARGVQQLSLPSQPVALGCQPAPAAQACFNEDDLLVVLPRGSYRIEGVRTNRLLAGEHNLLNIAAAGVAALLAGASEKGIARAVASFKGLPHRLEYVGNIRGIHFYNDSIATIPEAVLEALKACPDAFTLILGGHDRGVDYGPFMDALQASHVRNLVMMGAAGQRMLQLTRKMPGFAGKTMVEVRNLHEAFQWALMNTPPGKACLLSPAAASYDAFRNFEERGDLFRLLVNQQQ